MLLPLSGYYDSPKSSKGQSCQSDRLHVGHYSNAYPHPPYQLFLDPPLWFPLCCSLVWSVVLVPLLLLFLQSQIKVTSFRKKTYLHASVIPEYLGYAFFFFFLDMPLLRHTKNTVVSLTLMLDCEVFQGRDWVLI